MMRYSLETLEMRILRSASTFEVRGRVVDVLHIAGAVAYTGLTDRIVYDDLNGDGRRDENEPFSLTDLNGGYKLKIPSSAPGAQQNLRVVELTGWGPAEAGTDSAMVTPSADDADGPTFAIKMERPVAISVLASYTAGSMDGRDKHAMAAFVRTLFIEANQVFANSDTNLILNPERIVKTAYRESGSIDTDLDNLGNGSGVLASTQALRDSSRANLSVLFTSGDLTSGDDIGVAYEFDPTDPDPSENGFSTVALQEDGTDGFTLAHEIGHNLGAGHDAPDNDGPGVTPYAYGYHFIGENGRLYQDVMDYSNGTVLPFFSTPYFDWQGEPIGNASHADNARIVRADAPAVAKYR